MQDDYDEFPELGGKTIRSLRIYKETVEGTALQIQLTDGTNFVCSVGHQRTVKATLYRGGVGTPETLRECEL